MNLVVIGSFWLQTKRFLSHCQGHAFCLEENTTGRNRRNEPFRITLTLTHTHLGRFLGDRFVGEDADPELTLTFHITGDSLTRSSI